MQEIAYYDGQIGSSKDLAIPFDDRSHFFGDGVYDATISGNKIVYLLNEHLDRFYSSAKSLEINIPMTKPELFKLITDLTAKVDSKTCFVYWQVTRGVSWRCHAYPQDMQGKIAIFVRPEPDVLTTLPKPVKAITVDDNRFELCNIKTLNLIPSVMAYNIQNINAYIALLLIFLFSIVSIKFVVSNPNIAYIEKCALLRTIGVSISSFKIVCSSSGIFFMYGIMFDIISTIVPLCLLELSAIWCEK